MALSWIEKLLVQFAPKAGMLVLEEDEVELPPEPDTAMQKIRKAFNPITDLMVMSEDFLKSLPMEDWDWVMGYNSKVIFFKDNTLINIAIIKSGYAWVK